MCFFSTKAVNEQYSQLTSEKDAHITKTEATIREGENEIQELRDAVTRCVYAPEIPVMYQLQQTKKSHWLIFLAPTPLSAKEAHLAVQENCEELKLKLSATEAEKQSQCLKMTAEIDDLNRTKTNLEERLIELIRYVLSLAQLSAASRPSAACNKPIISS